MEPIRLRAIKLDLPSNDKNLLKPVLSKKDEAAIQATIGSFVRSSFMTLNDPS